MNSLSWQICHRRARRFKIIDGSSNAINASSKIKNKHGGGALRQVLQRMIAETPRLDSARPAVGAHIMSLACLRATPTTQNRVIAWQGLPQIKKVTFCSVQLFIANFPRTRGDGHWESKGSNKHNKDYLRKCASKGSAPANVARVAMTHKGPWKQNAKQQANTEAKSFCGALPAYLQTRWRFSLCVSCYFLLLYKLYTSL